MVRRYGEQEWFYPYDFMPPRLGMGDECFVGYEATARLSEIHRGSFKLTEAVRDGKYKKHRLILDNVRAHLHEIPEDMRIPLIRELEAKDLMKIEHI